MPNTAERLHRDTDVQTFLTTLAERLKGKTADAQHLILTTLYRNYINPPTIADRGYIAYEVTTQYLGIIFIPEEQSLKDLITWMAHVTGEKRAITPGLIHRAATRHFMREDGELYRRQVPIEWTKMLERDFGKAHEKSGENKLFTPAKEEKPTVSKEELLKRFK